MKEQSDYQAICCNTPMRDMGMWPMIGHLGKSEPQEDESVNIVLGDEHLVYCHRFHCSECDRYIGISWHQAPNKERADKRKLVIT